MSLNGFFHESFNEEEYYVLSQNIDFQFPKNIPTKLDIKARLLNKDGALISLENLNNEIIINKTNK